MAMWELAPGSPWNAIFSFFVISVLLAGLITALQVFAIAFSSEVVTGSREENASKQRAKASFKPNEALAGGGRLRGRPAYRPRAGRRPRWSRRSASRLPVRGAVRAFPAFPAARAVAAQSAPAQR